MKHLKRFNEELSPSVYNSASSKLREIGHSKRADKIDKWSKSENKRKSLDKWKKNIDMFSPYGKITLNFNQEKHSNYDWAKFDADFYFSLIFDDNLAKESIKRLKNNSNGYFNFSIPFLVGLIPVDDEIKIKCDSIMTGVDFTNGFYWGMVLFIDYSVEDEKLLFKGVKHDPFEYRYIPEILDRKSALVFKTSLKNCFDETSNYPMPSVCTEKYPFAYDILNKTLCQDLELLPEYNLSMERILSDINSFSINKLYKE